MLVFIIALAVIGLVGIVSAWIIYYKINSVYRGFLNILAEQKTPTSTFSDKQLALNHDYANIYGEIISRLPKKTNNESPLITDVKDPDTKVSPYSGLTKKHWLCMAKTLLEGALQYTDGMEHSIRLPSSKVAGYPRVSMDGSLIGEQEAYMESYARTLLLASAILKCDPEYTYQGRRIAEYYMEYLLRGVSYWDSASFGHVSDGGPSQKIVEAAAIVLSLSVSRSELWLPLSINERADVAAWLGQCTNKSVYSNNWLWFRVLINTFLKREGYAFDARTVEDDLLAINAQYAGSGWYRDGNKFDYYSAWAMQFYPIYWAIWDGDSFPLIRDRFHEQNRLFLESYPHLFSRQGEMPLWGRSICYRFAASSPLALAFHNENPGIDPGFARRLCSGNLLQFVCHPEFLMNGIPSLGFYGENRKLVDVYSCTASPYWAAKLFLAALSLPDDNVFWTANENEGFWHAPPDRFEIGTTGMWVEHNAYSGNSRLYAAQSTIDNDIRYSAKYFDTADVVYRSPIR